MKVGKNSYLFIEDLNSLKLKTQKNSNLYKRLIEQCNLYEIQNLPSKHPEKNIAYMGMAAANLSMLALINGEKRWIDEAKRWIFTILSYKEWLGHSASWLIYGLGLSYSWIAEHLNDEEIEQFKTKLLMECIKLWDYKVQHSKDSWPVQYWQNHNWINYTCIATAAYALKDDYFERCDRWLKEIKENFNMVFKLLPDDGSDYEGVAYWRYGIIWLIQYAHLIKTEDGTDFFRKSKFLKNTFYYRLYQCAPVFEQNYNFGDCHDKRSGHSAAAYFKLASEYNIEVSQWMGENVIKNFLHREEYESRVKPGILPEAFLELLWYNPAIKKKSPTSLPKSRFFPDLGLLSCRSSWYPDAFAFSVKAGHPGGKKQWEESWKLQEKEDFSRRCLRHQHPDDGSFILWKGYNNYIIDDGYNREVKASDHNMVLFDGMGYIDEGKDDIFHHIKKEIHASIEIFEQRDNIVYYVVNLAKVYNKKLGVKHFKRHFFYRGTEDLVIFDEILSDKAKTISWQIHSEDYLLECDNQFHTTNNDFILNPILGKDLTVTRESKVVSAVMRTQEPNNKTRRKMENLSFNQKNSKEKTYFLNFIQTGNPTPKPTISIVDTEHWKGFCLKEIDRKDLFLFSTNKSKTMRKLPRMDVKSNATFIYLAKALDEVYDTFHIDGKLEIKN
ncbi:MAG: heparinase II/III family protein [Spirochaetaceae bacterium]